ncbi:MULTISPECIES: ROK family transcriptional regulator [Rhizobium/Agrobacterium group]|uniref:Xylose repressor n=1 Tax=Agrobacterium tomkonis CFBP 6623 TaxID=1183432 RepID=A0A1S7R2T5_9HYPH|nr:MULTISPECIES: ROK family transcriptional regulator [Rhizobium/Agrobacterium group]KRA68885.1 transcriptional regulator [Rhizobium sp. Root651]QCL91138.1 ROK family transcriptional regulator [Agrobacterium tumefaciens]TKT65783.1 ROK family transcriptional regulator [Agrobacterium sp. LC34]CUX46062.1 Xylose repressor [Agrobacterium tomkonis CFBP 6623]
MSAIASTELVRQKNSLSVMAALRLHGSLSHTDMSSFTGLASATVSAITMELERAGLILRKEQLAATGRGRPRILFAPRGAFCHVAIVIISSDSVQYSLVDYAGKLVDRFTEQRLAAEKGTFGGAILAGLARLADRSRIDRHDILQVSISSKGLVDAAAATLVWSPVLGNERIDFRQLLSADGRNRVTLNNETLLAAKAIRMREQTKDEPAPEALVTLSLGHSIGLGIARSAGGTIEVSAPNFGHMLHLADGALCRCGTKGCIEAYSGFYAILRSAFEAPPQAEPAKFVPIAEVDKIAASARAGARMARFAFRTAGLALGNGLSRLFSLHGHMPVFVTGPGTRYFDLLESGLHDGLAQSQAVRFGGMPKISITPDEPELVFEGHMEHALSAADDYILSADGPEKSARNA